MDQSWPVKEGCVSKSIIYATLRIYRWNLIEKQLGTFTWEQYDWRSTSGRPSPNCIHGRLSLSHQIKLGGVVHNLAWLWSRTWNPIGYSWMAIACMQAYIWYSWHTSKMLSQFNLYALVSELKPLYIGSGFITKKWDLCFSVHATVAAWESPLMQFDCCQRPERWAALSSMQPMKWSWGKKIFLKDIQ